MMGSFTGDKTSIFYLASGLFILMLALGIATDQFILITIPFALLLFQTGWVSFELLFFLLIASIPISSEIQVTENLGTDLPDEFLMLVVSGLFMFHVIVRGKGFMQRVRHPLTSILLMSFAWLTLSAMFSSNPAVSVKFILAKAWYICAFFAAAVLVAENKQQITRTGLVLAVSMSICTMIILVRHALLGYSFAGINAAVSPFFRNHVNYSALLVCTLPLWYAGWKLSGSLLIRRLITGMIIVLLAALFFSYARGAWLALIAAMIAGWLIHKRMIMRACLAVLLIISILFTWLAVDNNYLRLAPDHYTTIFHQDFREHLVATYQMKDLSAAERFYRWVAGIRMIPDHWVTGFGPGTFYQNYKPYAVPVFATWVSGNEERSTVHNYFLLTAIEQGIPGLLMLLVLIGVAFYYSQHLYHRCKDVFYRTAALVTGLIFSMILTLNFLSDLIETDKIGSLFFLCIAMLVVIDKKTEHTQGL